MESRQHKRTFCEEISYNFYHLKLAMRQEPLRDMLLFFVLYGITRPSTVTFLYFFKQEVLGLSQAQVNFINFIGLFPLLFVASVYRFYMQGVDSKVIYRWLVLINMIASVGDLLFVLKVHRAIGISDMVASYFTASALTPLIYLCFFVPGCVIIAKLIPTHVEASVYAIAVSIANTAFYLLSSWMCLFWNLFFGITSKDMSNLYKLCIVQVFLSACTIFYVRFVPDWSTVFKA